MTYAAARNRVFTLVAYAWMCAGAIGYFSVKELLAAEAHISAGAITPFCLQMLLSIAFLLDGVAILRRSSFAGILALTSMIAMPTMAVWLLKMATTLDPGSVLQNQFFWTAVFLGGATVFAWRYWWMADMSPYFVARPTNEGQDSGMNPESKSGCL